jgi:hypothetical protein
MIKRGRGACLALESFECVLVAGQFVRQKLQRDQAAQLDVLGAANDTHPAAPQLFDDPVMRDGGTDHRQQSNCRHALDHFI